MVAKVLALLLNWALVLVVSCIGLDDTIRINHLENLILEKVNDAISYDFPKNNSEFFEGIQGGKVHDYGIFDFIIVGSGSTGSVLARRLSFVRSWKILVLEAGEADDEFLDIPGMQTYSLSSKNNWGYNTTSQRYGCKGMINNQCSYPRGKVLGGSSSINGLIYTRGNPRDYDEWEELGNRGWSFENVEPFFKKMENVQFNSEEQGHSGPLYVNYSSPVVPLQTIFSEALAGMGYLPTNYNSESQFGSSRLQSNIKYGKRVSGANAYIRPVLHRKNLNITLRAFVTKILIDDNTKTASGVRFTLNGIMYDVHATKEIILSAGAINSPQILMLSGIGQKYLLDKYNIPLKVDLPVGENLIDQIAYSLQFTSNYTQDSVSLTKQVSDFLKGEGLLTAPFNGKSVSFVTEDGAKRPTIELVLIPPAGVSDYTKRQQSSPYIQSITEAMGEVNPTNFFSIVVIILHPKSTGKVVIQSSNPELFPLIDSRIFSVEEDIETLYKAIQFAINVTKTEPFKRINASVFSPVPDCYQYSLYSKEYWYCAITYMAIPTYHSAGTTSMGVDPKTSVVDQELRVHGIKNLRVADCGVIPSTLSGHTSGPAFMIGEKLSSLIKGEYFSLHDA